MQFHSHADSHVGYQPEIERLLESTNPEWVNLCFDTGHIAYYGGDCLELIQNYPERIGYLHLKQVNPVIVEKVLDKDLSFPEAVRMGAMIEPPLGVPDMPPLLEAVAGLGRDIDGIIEHDLYPCSPDLPLPIAKRTKTYLSSCSGATVDFGRRVAEPLRIAVLGVGMMGAFHVDALSKRIAGREWWWSTTTSPTRRPRSPGGRGPGGGRPDGGDFRPRGRRGTDRQPGRGARGAGQRLPGRRRPGAV